MRVVFMGTPEFAVPALEAIHASKTLNAEIVAVYTQPDRPVGRGLAFRPSAVKSKALELGLPVFQPEKLTLPGEYERLAAFSADVIVVAAYGQILKRNVLDLPRLGCVNIHSSLLPRWRGAAPIHWALLAGDSETGVTTMLMAEKLDAGDVLLQAKTPIQNTDTAGALHDRLAFMGADLIQTTLERLAEGSLRGTPQDESQVTIATKLTKQMEWLDPNETAASLERKVRALNPWPGTSVWLGAAGRLKIKRAVAQRSVSGAQGKIFEKMGMLLLGTREGALELHTVQWDGKSPVSAAEFLNGLRGRGNTLPLEISSKP